VKGRVSRQCAVGYGDVSGVLFETMTYRFAIREKKLVNAGKGGPG
jgi:hypothetical protein